VVAEVEEVEVVAEVEVEEVEVEEVVAADKRHRPPARYRSLYLKQQMPTAGAELSSVSRRRNQASLLSLTSLLHRLLRSCCDHAVVCTSDRAKAFPGPCVGSRCQLFHQRSYGTRRPSVLAPGFTVYTGRRSVAFLCSCSRPRDLCTALEVPPFYLYRLLN
jgi:hypothetical protein